MIADEERFETAIAAIDAANANDPPYIIGVPGRLQMLGLLMGYMASLEGAGEVRVGAGRV